MKIDLDTAVNPPFSLDKWLEDNQDTIDKTGPVDLFGGVVNGANVRFLVYLVVLTLPFASNLL